MLGRYVIGQEVQVARLGWMFLWVLLAQGLILLIGWNPGPLLRCVALPEALQQRTKEAKEWLREEGPQETWPYGKSHVEEQQKHERSREDETMSV